MHSIHKLASMNATPEFSQPSFHMQHMHKNLPLLGQLLWATGPTLTDFHNQPVLGGPHGWYCIYRYWAKGASAPPSPPSRSLCHPILGSPHGTYAPTAIGTTFMSNGSTLTDLPCAVIKIIFHTFMMHATTHHDLSCHEPCTHQPWTYNSHQHSQYHLTHGLFYHDHFIIITHMVYSTMNIHHTSLTLNWIWKNKT